MAEVFKRFVILILAFALGVGLLLALVVGSLIWSEYYWYETDEINNYGRIKGNNNNQTVSEFFMSYFPDEIEPWYEDVVFSYKANDMCSYNAEMHLEFTVSDSEQFDTCVKTLTEGLEASVFPYDEKYEDYIISNHLYVDPSAEKLDGGGYFLRKGAKMGRILVCREEQRIICEGIIAFVCCGGNSDDYDFYDRYGIHPLEYSGRFCNEEMFG